MNFNLVVVITFMAGSILIYSAVKDKNPKDVISNALNGKSAPTAKTVPAKGDLGDTPGASDPGTIITGV
jgi:hypothetical protein